MKNISTRLSWLIQHNILKQRYPSRILSTLVLIPLLFFSTSAWSQFSLIDTVLQSRASIVTVTAVQMDLSQSSQTSAAIDPVTKRIVVGKKVQAVSAQKSGAGVIIREDGYIVTNIHTIFGANQIFVQLNDQKNFAAQVVKLLGSYDLALLKISPPQPLTPIAFSDSNSVELGDDVVNIGHSQWLKETLSGGKIIGLGTSPSEDHSGAKDVEIIEVNITLQKGDSGGPLLDRTGRLIGMMVAKIKSKERASFAIPSNKIKKLYLDSMK